MIQKNIINSQKIRKAGFTRKWHKNKNGVITTLNSK